MNVMSHQCPVKLTMFNPNKTDCLTWLNKFQSYVKMRNMPDSEALEMVRFYVSDPIGVWYNQIHQPDLTVEEFEEAFRDEYGILDAKQE